MFVLLHPILREKSSYMVGVVQLVRAPDCGSGGRGFEPHLPPQERDRIGLSLFLSPTFHTLSEIVPKKEK